MSRNLLFATQILGAKVPFSTFSTKKTTKFSVLFLLLLLQLVAGWSQQSITVLNTAVTQNFSGMGTSATATLPTGFKIGTDWSTGTSATTLAAGNTGTGVLTGTSGGGTYNYAEGVTGSSTERALGFLTTGGFSSPRSIIYAFTNNTGSTIASLTLSWNYEKYRSGSRAFAWTFFHGATSTAATAATGGDLAYIADANNTVISNPALSTAKSVTLTGLSIANGTTYYIRWTYTGSGGSTNAQGLAIDDFSLTAASAATAPLAPTIGTITPSNGQLSVAFTAGGDGGSAITNYAYSTDNGGTFTDLSPAQTSSPILITGLVNGTIYDVKIRAINTIGNGDASAAVQGTPATVSDAPSITGITTGNTTLTVAFTAPTFNGGAAVSNYKYSINNGASFTAVSPAQTSSPIVITGLTNGVTYDIQLLAVNAQGDGAASTTVQGTPEAPLTPTVLATGTLSAFTATYGSPSAAGSFLVSGSSLSADIVVTAPAGFEVSQTIGGASGYASSQTLTQVSGTVNNTTIYVRLAAGTAAGAHSGNVTITSTGATTESISIPSSTINTLGLTITGISINNKEYDGGTSATIAGTASLSGIFGTDDVSLSGTASASFDTKNIGIGKSVSVNGYTLSGTAASNYSLNAITGLTADISVATVTVSGATAADKAYDGTSVATISGGTISTVFGSDDVTVSASGLFADPNVANNIVVAIALTGADAGNYQLTQPNITANITPGAQTITFNAITTKTTTTADFNPGATSATSGVNPITYTSSNTAVATIVGGNIHIVGSGTTIITASQAASANYNAATDVSQTLNVLEGFLAWDFFGEGSTTNTTSTAEVISSYVGSGGILSRGAGAAYSAAGNSFRTVGFQNNGIATSNTDYFQFSLTPAVGYVLSLSTLDARLSGTASFTVSPGVSSQFAYSLDGTNYTLIGSSPIFNFGSK
jgi:hypothetical protein